MSAIRREGTKGCGVTAVYLQVYGRVSRRPIEIRSLEGVFDAVSTVKNDFSRG
jgi:hypothetical protein